MKIADNRLRPQDARVLRQERVDAADPSRDWPLLGGIEVDDLRRRMDACIGAARRDRGDRLAGDLAKRALERVLHATPRRLRLPAAKYVAGVFDSERNAHK